MKDLDITLARIVEEISKGNPIEALSLVETLQAHGAVYQGLFYLRSVCEYKIGKKERAYRSLKAELRHFPNDIQAQNLMKTIEENLFGVHIEAVRNTAKLQSHFIKEEVADQLIRLKDGIVHVAAKNDEHALNCILEFVNREMNI